jgi:hypothetical protein
MCLNAVIEPLSYRAEVSVDLLFTEKNPVPLFRSHQMKKVLLLLAVLLPLSLPAVSRADVSIGVTVPGLSLQIGDRNARGYYWDGYRWREPRGGHKHYRSRDYYYGPPPQVRYYGPPPRQWRDRPHHYRNYRVSPPPHGYYRPAPPRPRW